MAEKKTKKPSTKVKKETSTLETASKAKGKPITQKATPKQTDAMANSKTTKKKTPNLLPFAQNSNNRIIKALSKASFRSKKQLAQAVRTSGCKPVELAPALHMLFMEDEKKAVKMAEAYATSLNNIKEHREVFSSVALMDKPMRMTLIKGYRNAGAGRGVVEAISQLPRGQARTIMQDFVIKEDKTKDKEAIQDVMYWLRDAGASIRKQAGRNTSDPANPTDSAVVEFFEDVGEAIVDAVTSVVDAIGDTLESLGQAIVDVVNWTADAVANLVSALGSVNSFV